MSSSDEASSFTGSEVEKLSASATSSPSNSPCVNTLDKWAHSRSNDIVVDVLTPPREEDSSNTTQGLASEVEEKKPKGRLKFFKDGLLCLELLHHDEGRSTKWTQSKAKTIIPPVVRIAKEAKIPCQSISALFSITSPLKASNADKGPTTLLPPREPRKCGWGKSNVPVKGASSELTFYMKPAPCVHSFVLSCKKGRIPASLHRRPCQVQAPETDRPYNSQANAVCGCQEEGKTQKINSSGTRTQRKSLLLVLEDLSAKKLLRSEEIVEKSAESPPTSEHIRARDEQSKVLSAAKSAASASKKKSRSLGQGQHESYSKPILNVPGAFKKFKTKSNEKWPLKPPQHASLSFPLPFPLPMALSMVYGNADANAINGKSARRSSTEDKVERLRKNLRTNRNRFGAKESASSDSTLSAYREKVARTRVGEAVGDISLARINSLKANEVSTYLDRESQDLLKQRTISTAISYTINSLLGNGQPSSEESCENDTQKYRKAAITSPSSPVDNHKRGGSIGVGASSSQYKLSAEDPTLFLRHLLDTSDPIPSPSGPSIPTAAEGAEKATKLSRVHAEEKGCSNLNGKEERAYKRKSPKSAATPNAYKNKVLITEKGRKPDPSNPNANYGSRGRGSGRERPGKSEDVVSTFHRHNPSAGFSAPVPFPVFNSTSRRPNLNYDTALNLCRRETSPSANGIMDLSLSSKNRASLMSDQRWCGQNGGNTNFDDDVPLNLSKNARAN